MTESINRDLATSLSAAVINDTLTSTGEISGGITVVSNVESLPAGAVGDRAFVTSTDGYYIHSGDGWFQIALINTTPVINSLVDANGDSATSPFVLDTEGATSVITVTATDPEGTPIIYSAVTDTGFDGMATVSQSGQDFTITPLSQESATTESGTITFRASDNVNIATQLTTFTLVYSTITENSSKTTILAKAFGNNGDNTIFSDGSTNSHTITTAGNTVSQTFSPYRAGGYSAYFDGIGDYLSIPTDTSLELGSSNYTIECWFYLTTSSVTNGGLISMGQSGSTITFASLQFDASRRINWFVSQYSAVSPVLQSPVIQMNTWYHVAVTRNGNDHAMYLNGISVDTTQTTSYTNTIGNVFYIGCGWYATNRTFYGYITDARLVKGTAVYTSNFTPSSERLTAITNTSLLACHLPYFADGSSNSRTITVNGDTKVEPFGPYDYEPYDSSKHGSSVYFDGSGDYVQVASSSDFAFGSNDFTIEFWAYPEAIATAAVLDPRTTDSQAVPWIGLRNTGYFYYYVSGSNRIVGTAGTVTTNKWYHVAVSRSSGTTKMFVNGTQIGSDYSDSTSYVQGGPWRTGTRYNNTTLPFNGYITDFRCINGTALYTANFTPPTAPLTAITNTSLLLQSSPNVYDASGNTRVKLHGVTSANLNTKYTSNIVLDGGAEYVFFHPKTGSYHNDVTGDFTVETWIRLDSNTLVYPYLWIIRDLANTSGPRIIARFGDSGFGYHLQFEVNGTGFEAVHSVNLTQSNFNTYRHVALTRSNGVVRCFVDGTQYSFGTGANPSSFPNSTISFSNSITNINQIYIGYEVDGQMEDFRFTNGLARYPFTPLRETLTADANTKFLTGHASTITDGSDNNHTITASGAFASGFGPGPGMNSISFDGSNDYLRCDAALDWDEGPGHNFTIEGWAYFNTIGSVFETLVGINKASNGSNHLLFGATSGNGFVVEWDGGPATPIGVTLNTNKWYHWAVVYTGLRIEVYINGSHVYSVTDTTDTRLQNCTLLIGAEADAANAGTIGNFLDGYISNFRISAGIRYTPDFTPPTSELLG